MKCCNLNIPFNLKSCLTFCNNSTSCTNGCLFYSYIKNNNGDVQNFKIDEKNKLDIISSFEVVQNLNQSFEVVLVNSTVFVWPPIFSKNRLIESVYLITVNVVNGDNSTETVIGLESQKNFDLKNTFLCFSTSSVSSFSTVPKFQLNIYPINYNGYNKSIKLTSNFTNCYTSSYANQCICNISAVQQSSQSQPDVVLQKGYFNYRKEFTVNKGSLLGILDIMRKEYTVHFKLKPKEFTKGLKSVLHSTLGNNYESYGDRNPGVWFHEDGSGKLVIFVAVNGNNNYYIETTPLLLDEWSTVKIYQSLLGDKYWLAVELNGVIIHSVENSDPRDFKNMIVYASDIWYDAQNCSITDLLIINGNVEYIVGNVPMPLEKGKIVALIPNLNKEYFITFDVYPDEFLPDYHSLIHFTVGSDNDNYGDRTPGIWFDYNGQGKLRIGAPINGGHKYYTTNPIALYQWLNVEVSQTLKNSVYVYQLKINGKSVCSVNNNQAQNFKNVKVYASDPWYKPQNGLIRNLFFINGNSSSQSQPAVVLRKEYIVGNVPMPLEKGKIIALIPNLNIEYFISFDVYPNEFLPDYHSLIHFTIGSDNDNYGDRTPGIWFDDRSLGKLQIGAPINGSHIYFLTNPIALNQWLNIEVSQTLKNSLYGYQVKINGKIVYFVNNNQAQSFENVKVYASDPWYKPQNGSIRNLIFINGNSSTQSQPAVILPKVSQNQPAIILPKDKSLIILAITVPILFLVLIVTVVVMKMYRIKSKYKFQRSRLQNFKSSTDDWEISPDTIIFDKKIGEGAFGTVFFAKINSKVLAKIKSTKQKPGSASLYINQDFAIDVAVKLLKDSANQSEFDDFREEINLMKEIGYHKNIVNMLGCSTIVQPLCLVVEFMENGDLLHFLRNRRNKLCASKFDGESAVNFIYTKSYQQTLETTISEICTAGCMPNEIPLDEIGLLTPNDLLSFAWQAASGMEFLSCNKLVHRDLAARNILVGGDKNIKISDFGLTRKTNEELNYTSNKNRRLPIKWMSIEAIFDQMFTSCSDVWAYGVVLFEIVTLGGTPYPTKSNSELLALLKTGYRMERPENCSEPMYDIMLHCWNEDPLQRPTFTELREHLDKIISQGDSYFNFDVNEQNTYYNAPSFNSLEPETPDDATDKEIFDTTLHVKSNEEMHIFSEGSIALCV